MSERPLVESIRSLPIFYALAFVGILSAYFFRILMAKTLTPVEYGSFYAVVGLLTFLLAINEFGLGPSFIFHFSKHRSPTARRRVFSFIFACKVAVAAILGLFLLLFHDWLAIHYFHDPSLSRPLLLFVPFFLFEGTATFAMYYFGAIGRSALYASVGYVRLFIALLFGLFAVIAFPRSILLTGFFLVWFFASVAVAVGYSSLIPWRRLLTSRFTLRSTAPIARYALMMLFSAAGGVLLLNLDVLFITYFRSPLEVGFYATALPLGNMLLLLVEPLISFLQPFVIRHHHLRASARLSEMLNLLYDAGVFLLLPFAMLLVFFSREIILITFGEYYAAAAPALAVLGIALFFRSFQGINFTFLYGTGQLHPQMNIMWLGVLLNVLLLLFLVPAYGFIGAAWSTLFALAFMVVASFLFLRRSFHLRLPIVNWVKTAALSLTMVGLVAVLRRALPFSAYVKAAAVGALFICAYFGIGVFVLRIVNWQKLRALMVGMLRREE